MTIVIAPSYGDPCPSCGERALAWGPTVGLWACGVCKKSFRPGNEALENKHVAMAVRAVSLLAAERERAGHSKEDAKRSAIIDVVEAVKRLQTPGNEDYPA
jgi:ribosomal protein L37AE/L43A